MRNDSEGIDVGTSTEVDERSEPEDVVSEVDGARVLPSGSRTLDTRLNPEAPDFVPGVTNSLLATKIVDELLGYTRWSTAAGEDISYGPRYDSIWSESSIQLQTQAFLEPLPERNSTAGMQQANIIEVVGDQEEPPSPTKRSDKHSSAEVEPVSKRSPPICCCACM